MTEKRFTMSNEVLPQPTVRDKGSVMGMMEVVGLLNEQHETIQVLKASNGEMEDYLARLEEENEQLKSELGKLNILYKAKCKTEEQLLEMGKEVEKKNEQLKSKNRGLQSELQIFKEDVTHSNLQINKLTDENEQLKQKVESKQRVINAYEQYINDLKEDGEIE